MEARWLKQALPVNGALGSVRRVRAGSVPRGRIVRSLPKAGTNLRAGSRVALRIRA